MDQRNRQIFGVNGGSRRSEKALLFQRFGDAGDAHQAQARLRNMRQAVGETVQVWAERILDLAGEAF